MAIKELRKTWDHCQLDYVRHYIVTTEADIAKLPTCCLGSTCVVSETNARYVCGKGKVWKKQEEAMEEGPGSSGGASSWNDLQDKPFGEEVSYSDTLRVSKTPEEIEELANSGQLVGGMLLKVADSVVTMNDLANGFTVGFGGEVVDIPADEVGEVAEEFVDGLVFFMEAFYSVGEQAVGVNLDGIVFTEKGLYINAYVMAELPYLSLAIPGFQFFTTVVKKIDEKYLPDKTIVFTDETYLYRDAELTTKYNAGELPHLTRMVIGFPGGAILIMPTTFVHGEYEYDIVGVNLASGYKTYKTAEYTGT